MNASQVLKGLKERGYLFEHQFHPYQTSIKDYLKRHDIVFKSPQKGGYEGLPLGNGDMGAMVWTTDRGVMLQLNKNDVWTQPDEEAPMLQRSCARMMIDFCQPCNEWLYLKEFEARLSIAEAKAKIQANTPFCRNYLEVWIDPDENLIGVEIEHDCGEAEGIVRMNMERYGSRAFSHWYNGISRKLEDGIGKARARVKGKDILIEETFDEISQVRVACVARLLDENYEVKTLNNKLAEIEWHVKGSGKTTLLIAVASNHLGEDPTEEAVRLLDKKQVMLTKVKERHSEWWEEYWNRSFMHITKNNQESEYDYMENLYYIHLYALACASRGTYPMTFNGATFTWNRDVRQWVNPHHWNTQQSYWAVEASNRPELMEPYINTYNSLMTAAKVFAEKTTNVKQGMLISEAHDFSGRMVGYHRAFTPASQIAQQFWNHYLYNGDKNYLREVAYPFIKECADFYVAYATLDSKSGQYWISKAAVYECEFGSDFTNTVVDMTMVRYILPIAMEAAKLLGIDEEKQKNWKYLLENIADFIYWEKEKQTLAMGLDQEGKKVTFPDQNTTFCRNVAPIMPCAIVGSRNKGSKLYNAVYNGAQEYTRNAVAITPIGAVWARLGEGDKAIPFLFNAIEQLQHFPQGFYYNIDHWYQYSRYAKKIDDYLTECQRDYIYDQSLYYEQIEVRENPDEKIDIPMTPFIQPGFETPGILVHTLNEMALQSYEGVIRVFPALPTQTDYTFTLKAIDGFMVTAFAKRGEIVPLIIIKSLLGKACTIENPFKNQPVHISNSEGERVLYEVTEYGDLKFETKSQDCYIIYTQDINFNDVPSARFILETNQTEKVYHQARIGSRKTY